MEPKLLLMHSILLLYWESKLDTKTDGSRNLIREVVETISPPEATLDTDTDRAIIVGLKNTIHTLLQEDTAVGVDKLMLLQRICLNTKGDDSLYRMFCDSMEGEPTQDILRRLCIDYARTLQEARKLKNFMDMVRQWSKDVLYSDVGSMGRIADLAMRMQAQLDDFIHGGTVGGIAGIAGMVDTVDFDDPTSISDIIEKARKESSIDGVLKTGHQAFNRMLGYNGGIRRGEFMVVGAFQHNYKTGFTLGVTRQIAMYNTPFMVDPTKKPLILHISSENSLTDNIMLMYRGLYENIFNEACDTTTVPQDQAAEWIKMETMKSGYHLRMHRVNPSEFSYNSLFELILEYEAQGFEIHLLTIDYLNMLNKSGCSTGPYGFETRDLFRRVRNFCSARKIAVITPHQISMDAKALQRAGMDLIVKELVGKSYWDSCKTIDQEVDIEILIHIEIVNGKSYLTLQRGKHRTSTGPITPLKDLFAILPFFTVGAVRDDINGVDLSVKKLGQRTDPSTGQIEEEEGFFEAA